MTLLDRVLGLFQPSNKLDGRQYGVYPAKVVANNDPNAIGRVQVIVPTVSTAALWARTATLMAGNNRGSWFMPEVDDEVLVAFEGGDPRQPYVVGALWNSAALPPEQMDSSNSRKSIVTRSGVRIMIDDSGQSAVLTLQTPAGQSVILEDAAQSSVRVQDANGNSIVMNSTGITINSATKVTVQASTVDIQAGMVNVASGMNTFSGVVKCDTLIANSVVASSYTPGAGNIW